MQFDEFLKVLDLLQNPDKYAAQIAELTQRHDSIQVSIEHLNSRIAVAVTQEEADKNLAEAKKTVADAKEEAKKITEKASASFDKKLADLVVRETAAEQAIQAHQNAKLLWAERKAEHIAKEKQLGDLRKQLDDGIAEMAKKQAEVDARLNKLRQAMG